MRRTPAVPLRSIIAAVGLSAAAAALAARSEDVTLALPDATGELAGTLTNADGADTVIVLVAGSGPTDRDGNQPGLRNDGLRQLADALAADGISTLRYDKRGVGRSAVRNLREQDLRVGTFADDLSRWVAYLERRAPGQRIGLFGHSEGGLVASLAAGSARPAFVVLAGTPGRPFDELLRSQLDGKLPAELAGEAEAILAELKAGRVAQHVPDALAPLFRQSVQPYLMSLIDVSPADLVRMFQMPLMILQGDRDLQVGVVDAQRLATAQPRAVACLVPGMNHVLKEVGDEDDPLKAYTDPSFPLGNALVTDIVRFVGALRRDPRPPLDPAAICTATLPRATSR